MNRILRTSPLLLLLALAACEGPPAGKTAPPAGKTAETAKPAGPVLPFIADDYPAALAQARQRDLPIFVESWAPW